MSVNLAPEYQISCSNFIWQQWLNIFNNLAKQTTLFLAPLTLSPWQRSPAQFIICDSATQLLQKQLPIPMILSMQKKTF